MLATVGLVLLAMAMSALSWWGVLYCQRRPISRWDDAVFRFGAIGIGFINLAAAGGDFTNKHWPLHVGALLVFAGTFSPLAMAFGALEGLIIARFLGLARPTQAPPDQRL